MTYYIRSIDPILDYPIFIEAMMYGLFVFVTVFALTYMAQDDRITPSVLKGGLVAGMTFCISVIGNL